MNIADNLVSNEAAITLRKLRYHFENAKYWCSNDTIVVRTSPEVGYYLLSADIPLCTLSEAQIWIKEYLNISIEPVLKAFSINQTFTYDCYTFDLLNKKVLDSKTFNNSNYHNALKQGIDNLLINLQIK